MGLFNWVTKSLGIKRAALRGSPETYAPSFEQLEPRVLLSADCLMPLESPLIETPFEAAICVDLETDQVLSVAEEQLDGLTVGPSDSQTITPSHALSVSQSAMAVDTITTQQNEDLSSLADASEELLSETESSKLLHTSESTLQTSALGIAQNRGPPTEIVFIDSSLNLDFRLENADQPGVLVSVLDADQDGLLQITSILPSYSGLSAIHIVSHGAPGQVLLCDGTLEAETLERNAGSLSAWGESLTVEGDILLYGCSVGAGQLGSTFIEQLALITRADVAASNNPTGNVEYGGDWILEKVSGRVQTTSLKLSEVMADYWGILTAAPFVTMIEPTGTQLQPVDSVQFTFDRPMDQLSFSTSKDVVSFTGPQGPLTVTGYGWTDENTLELTFASQTATGTYELILGASILDLAGVALDQDGDGTEGESEDDRVTAAFSINSAPDVVSSSLLEGEVLEPDVLTVTLTMSEDLDGATLDTTGVTLVENSSGELYSPLSYSYDASTDELGYEFALLGEGRYTLTLVGGAESQIVDLLGSRMIEDFTVDFSVDTDVTPFPVPLEAGQPLGSLVYEQGHETRAFHEVNDTDSLTVTLDSSQLATLALFPLDPSIRGRIELFDPGDVSLGSAEAANAGDGVLLQALPVALEGLYRVEATSLEGTGQYEVRLKLNAGLETEHVTGISNDTRATAESMAPSIMVLPDGIGERAAFIGVVDGDHDYYQISLTAGDVVSVASAHPDGDLALELYDDSGTLLALGESGDSAQNVQNRIDRFHVGATGDYYLALSGGAETPYTLLVMINARFNVEPDDGRLLEAHSTLGFLGSSEQDDTEGGLIRVALLGNGNMNAQQQLADDTYFDFDPVLVSASEIDSVQELDAYDVVVIGDYTSHSSLVTVAPALRSWVEDGGGVVGVGWLVYAAGYYSGHITEIDAIIPVNMGANHDSRSNPSLTITDGSHPVTEGISDFTVPGYTEYSAIEVDAGAQLLGTVSGRPAVVVGEPGEGRGVYLSAVYSQADSYPGLRSGPSDQLFEQAVAWAARGGMDKADEYQISVNAGDVLTITTATPGDGAGEPVNDLDPLLELYDPSDALVDSDNNGAADGRNALITHTAAQTGIYRVRVSIVVGSGDVVLSVTGASGAVPSSLAVEQASINDGETLTTYPNTLDLTFDSTLLLSTVEAADLTVTGGPADSVTVVDGNTLRFDIASAGPGDGPYTLAIASDAMQNLQGVGNDEFLLSFTVDATSPVVETSSIGDGDIIEPGNLSYVATFSEDLDSDLLGVEDIQLIESGFGETFSPTSFVYDSAADTLTVEFEALYDGIYTLTLSSGPGALRDLVGNELNGAPSFPLPSGQGDLAPDDFVVDFVVDAADDQVYPVPLDVEAPLGSLIYDPFVVGTVFEPGDTDDYSITVDASQTFTIVVIEPSATLQPTIELFDSGGALLGNATAGMAGMPAILQTVPAATTDTYVLRIGGQAGSTGSYTARLILNAAVEEESFGGPSNDDLASAQDLDGSSIPLDGGGDRLAVVGETEGTGAVVPVNDIGFTRLNVDSDSVKSLTYLSEGVFLLSDGYSLFEVSVGGDEFYVGGLSDWTTGLAFVGGDLYAAGGYSDQLRIIDPGTGEDQSSLPLNLLGLEGFMIDGVNALATDPVSGTLWAILRLSGETYDTWGPRELAVIDVATGDVLLIGNTGDKFSALAFDDIGQLYGLTGTGADVSSTLYRLSQIDATVVEIGSPGQEASGGEALGFNPDDSRLYRAAGSISMFDGLWQAIVLSGDTIGDVIDIGFSSTGGESDPVKGLAYLSDGLFLLSDGTGLYELSAGGDATFVGQFDEQTSGLAFVSGDLYAASSNLNTLRIIDPETGWDIESIVLTLPESTIYGINALATDPTSDTLWAIIRVDSTSGSPRELAMIGVDTGEVTLVGNTGDRFSALAFDSSGQLFGLTGSGGNVPSTLHFLSTTDAMSTEIVPLSSDYGGEALGFNPDDGLLYRAAGLPYTDAGHWQSVEMADFGGSSDTYSFTLGAGQAATLVVDAEAGDIGLELYDHGGILLTQAAFNASNVDAHILDYVPTQAGTYYARVTSIDTSPYHLAITRAATFELESLPNGQDISVTGQVLGYVGNEPGLLESEFVFAVNPGDALALTTATPGGDVGEPVNLLDPLVELYDEAGTLVATDDNSAADGRNVSLGLTVPDDGGAQRTYRVVVRSVDENPGEFTLLIQGATGVPPFVAVSDDPVDGAILDVFPTTYRVDFNESVLLTSIDAADLTMNGTPANGVTAIDHDTFVFDVTGMGGADGSYDAVMAAGAITSLSGKPLEAFTSSFIFDTSPPTVVTSSISEDDIVPAGPVTYEASFSETMELDGLGPEDVALTNTTTGQTFVPDTFNTTADTVTVAYDALPEGTYTLRLSSSSGAFRDIAGVLLDGDSSFPLPSGDGVAGGDFIVGFAVDIDTLSFPVPLTLVEPEGSLIYEGSANGQFHAGDTDTFTIDLDSPQTATLVFTPQDPSIRASIELLDPSSASLGVVEATAVNDTIYLQTLPVAVDGTYLIQVTGIEGTGSYEIDLILNSAIENEFLTGAGNDTLGSAEDIVGSAIPIASDRLAVLGQTEDGAYDYYAFDLAANEFATLVVDGHDDSPVTLELLDSTGALLATGRGDANNVTQYIKDFSPPATDIYFARISGDQVQDYGLVVTRDAAYDMEPNDDKAPMAQNLGLTGVALGHLGGEVIIAETEPNNDVATANDWSTSFVSIGSNQYRAILTGTVSPGSDWDYFKIRVAQGDALLVDQEGSATGKGSLSDTYLAFYNSAGNHLASNDDGGVGLNSRFNWSSFPYESGEFFVAAGSYSSRTGTYTLTATLTTQNLLMTGGHDYYSIPVQVGDSLTVQTSTPGEGTGSFTNEVDPVITLFDESGTEVATDDNSVDGRNAVLNYTATTAGLYSIKVAGATDIPGEYVLQVSGYTGQAAPFAAESVTPADGSLLSTYPNLCEINFSDSILLTSLDASDLTVNGVVADSVTVIDANTLAFDISSADTGDGVFNVAIGAGAITSVSGQPLEAFGVSFDYDATNPLVSSSSVVEDETLGPGSLVYEVQFSEELETTDLGGEDVTLGESFSGTTFTPDAFTYDPTTSIATMTYNDLAEGNYTLTLLTSDTAFRDRRGNLLDGAPSFPLPSGDSSPGDPFVVHFKVDRTVEGFPTPLSSVTPLGSLNYSGDVMAVLNEVSDVDAFSLSLDPGQFISVVLSPMDTSIQGQVELLDPAGTSLGVVAASSPGQSVFLLDALASDAGLYQIDVSSLAGQGRYELAVVLNAAMEQEQSGGLTNNDLASAQSLDASFLDLGNGSQRAAVLGTADGTGSTPDLYAVSLTAGDVVTWILTNQGTGETTLELLDSTGMVLALGMAGGLNIGEAITDFVVPGSDVYYARITGDGNYSLVVARNTHFIQDTYFENFENGAGAEWSSTLTDNSVVAFTQFLGRFNNSPGVTFSLPTVSGREYMLQFDLMIIDSWDGSYGDYFNVDVDGTQRFHHTFSQFGGYQTYPGSPDVSGQNFGWSSWDDAIYRQVSIPFTASSATTQIHFYDGGLQALSDESWGIDNVRVDASDSEGAQTLVQYIGLTGRVLGHYTLDIDQYQFEANEGDVLSIYTTTPNDGPGEPVNTYDPYLQLYGPAELLVAVDDNNAPQDDGHNAGIAYTVPSGGAGTYVIALQGSGSGAYTLNVEGATASLSLVPEVISTEPADSAPLATPPSSVELTLSEAIRIDSVGTGDLTLDGGATVTDVTILDGRRVRFGLNVPDVDATYTYTLEAGRIVDLQGQGNAAYQGTFLIDKTGPHLIAQVPSLQASAPFAQLTFVFDEAIDPASFTTSDITQFTGPGGTDLRTQVTGITVTQDTATVTFNDQAAQGTYIMQIGPDIADLVGNDMDQDNNGTGGEASDYYIATVSLQAADLTVESIDAPDTGQFGAPLTLSWTVRNIGTDPAVEGWQDQVWLSADATYSADDIALLATPVSAPTGTIPLGVNAAYTQTVTVTLPLDSAMSDGIYYLLVRTDALNTQPENNENNNINPEPITLSVPPLPDLIVSDIDAPIEGLSGQTLQYSWTVTNQGDGDAAGTWYDRVFLSTDQSLGSDLYLGDFSFTGTIGAGQSITRTQSYTLPIAMEGDRWFIITTDRGNQLYEHNHEDNNALVDDQAMVVSLSPFPNLQVTDIIPPAEAFSSQQAVVEWVVTNTGTGSTSAPVWYDQLWLSQDEILGSDTYMGRVANPGYLTPGDSYVNGMTVTLPQGIQGDYFFIVQTDIYNQVYEHNDEDDNRAVS